MSNLKMTDKNRWYYKSVVTGAVTTDKEIKNRWFKKGEDIEFWRWSEVCGEFMCLMVEEH